MRVAIVGVGGIGGFFGGCLARAGVDVTFIARSKNLAALRTDGLRVESATQGNFVVRPVQATDTPAAGRPVDVALLCVKSWDVGEAARGILPILGPESVVIPVQNGVDAPDTLAAILGRERVLGGLAYVVTTLVAPGHVQQTSATLDHLVFGELDGGETARGKRVLDILQRGGFHVQLHQDIRAAMWEKFVFFAAVSGVCTASRLTIAKARDHPETRSLLERAMCEVEAVARAKELAIAPGIVARQMARLAELGPEAKPSMLVDLEHGRRLEVDALSGTVAREGARLGVPTPVHETLAALLAPFARGAPS